MMSARSQARGDLSQARILAAVQWQADHFENAPVIVIPCLHGRRWPGVPVTSIRLPVTIILAGLVAAAASPFP